MNLNANIRSVIDDLSLPFAIEPSNLLRVISNDDIDVLSLIDRRNEMMIRTILNEVYLTDGHAFSNQSSGC